MDVRQVIEEAIELAGRKTAAEHINTQVHRRAGDGRCPGGLGPDRIRLMNIIANAVESYADAMGPVKITVEPSVPSEDLAMPAGGLTLQISDLGCGMDEATRKKAASPFFSAKPAGRKRGMGLAFASRLIQPTAASWKSKASPATAPQSP